MLVTGGTGFVGANLVRRLLAAGHEVHLAVRQGFSGWRIDGLLDQLHLHTVDLAEVDAIGAWLEQLRPSWIFHLAVYGAYSNQNALAPMVRTNVQATMSLIDAAVASGVEAFVNTGSSSEYGFKDHAPDETEALEPNSPYAVTKAAGTLYASHVARRHRAPIVTLRLYSAYGPYEEPSRLLPRLLVLSRQGRWPPLVDPEVARDFVYVEDVVDAYLATAAAAAQHPGAVYNIGSGTQTTLRELVELVRHLRRLEVEPSWGSMTRREWDTTHWMANPARARRELGWQAERNLETGVGLMAAWLDGEGGRLGRYAQG